MKLSGEQRDHLASFVLAQDVAGAIEFVEKLLSAASSDEKQDEEAAPKKSKTAK